MENWGTVKLAELAKSLFFIGLRLLFSGIDRALLPVNSSWRCLKSKLYYCFKIISIDIDGKTVSGVAFYEKLQGTRLSQIPVHKYQDFIEIPPTLTSCNFLLSGRMKKSGCAFWSYVSVLSILLLFIDLEREKHTFRCWSKFEISINWHSHPQPQGYYQVITKSLHDIVPSHTL